MSVGMAHQTLVPHLISHHKDSEASKPREDTNRPEKQKKAEIPPGWVFNPGDHKSRIG